jgi:hypothetical protein
VFLFLKVGMSVTVDKKLVNSYSESWHVTVVLIAGLTAFGVLL